MKREGMNGLKVSTAQPVKHTVAHKFQGLPKFKLTEHDPADSLWNNPDDFWNMTYEARSKVAKYIYISEILLGSELSTHCLLS